MFNFSKKGKTKKIAEEEPKLIQGDFPAAAGWETNHGTFKRH